MTRIVALAERGTLPLLRLLAAVNLLLFVSFLAVLALAVGRAKAEEPKCSGRDLIRVLEANDPAALARVRAEAADVANGGSRLWRIEPENVAPSYLFGTMHVSDPRVTGLPPLAQAVFDGAGTVVIETTDILDQSTMMRVLAQRPDLMMFTDGSGLTSTLSPGEAATLEKGLTDRGIPPASVAKMKPWLVASLFSTPACEIARRRNGEQVLDIKLALAAKAADKKLLGLETALDQLSAMASLPLAFHLDGLLEAVSQRDLVDDVIETMTVLYVQDQIGMLWPLMRAVMPSTRTSAEGYAAFEERVITLRNHTMVKNAIPILDAGNAFIAVGAMHLVGPEGLVALLRNEGYRVTVAK